MKGKKKSPRIEGFFSFGFLVFSILILYLTIPALGMGRLVGLRSYSHKGSHTPQVTISTILFRILTMKNDLFPNSLECKVDLRQKTNKLEKETSHFCVFLKLILSSDFTIPMEKKQGKKVTKSELKNTVLGKEVFEKFTPKKDLNRRGANYIEKHVTVKTVNRFETCSNWMLHGTNVDLSAKRMLLSNRCGNRFCPICTWGTAKKDAIKLSIILEAIRDIEGKEFLFLTLTAPNCTGEELRGEINRFNKATEKLFKRRNVVKIVKGYARKLEVTTDQEKYVTEELYERKMNYYDRRNLKVGDPNPTYNTYNPHIHILIAVNKSYFNMPSEFISNAEWLGMWRECMNDNSITQVDARKMRTGKSNAVLEMAKYSAKGSDLYHSETVFDTFYTALKKRQLLVYSGMMKDYAKMFKTGELDKYKKKDENEYTHVLRSIWKNSKYESTLRNFTPEEYEKYNQRALLIEENNEVE